MIINRYYNLNLSSGNLFDFDLNSYNSDGREVTSMKAELGLLFESFKITYEIYNPFNERYRNDVQYSDMILPQLGRNSRINIIWIFKD